MNDISLENFRFSAPLHIRWNDLDPIGHVNNVMYFDYFQTGRGYYMPTASKKWNWLQHMFVIAHIECDYITELKIEAGNPKVWMRTTKIGTKSFEFEYLVTSEKKGETVIHCRGKSIQVMIDIQQKSSIEIPEWLKNDIVNYEPAL